jgi:amino acid transporter
MSALPSIKPPPPVRDRSRADGVASVPAPPAAEAGGESRPSLDVSAFERNSAVPDRVVSPEPAVAEPKLGHGFGTLPVFLAAISTILGAIMFLRFGYAVAHVGLLGAIAIVILGHMVTVPTALAISEIATNRKVEGGGEYFIISRSFGTTIGSAIGVSLYLSQAVSVSFYMIAFAEAFRPLAPLIEHYTQMPMDPRMVSVPATVLLILLMLSKGADLGVKALVVVVAVLTVSIILFFMGKPVGSWSPDSLALTGTVADPDSFFLVFAICFPAFTGMTAGVGLSGDLKDPRKSIPLGTMVATAIGGIVYFGIVIKLALSASPADLASDQLIMSRISIWGPIVPIGLGCATLSSAIGSILVAPRTLQALAKDRCFPSERANGFMAAGIGTKNEPRNATLLTGGLALAVVSLGNVDFVARMISMFFMVTYGAICAISFLEHFAANPSYRPSFRSKWYVSLFGALICLLMMFQMDPLYAALAIAAMIGLYRLAREGQGSGKDDVAAIFQGVMTQATRFMQIRLQQSRRRSDAGGWRPSILMVNARTFDRFAPLEFMSWLCHRHGFGTYLHFVPGPLDEEHHQQSQRLKQNLIQVAAPFRGLYVDTIVSPSIRSALAQSLQVPGVSGMENNTILFESSVHDPPEVAEEIAQSALFCSRTSKNILVLRHGDHHFGHRAHVHIWLTWHDAENATLMLLLAYILLGHRDWHKAELTIFAAFPRAEVGAERARLLGMIREGRIPVTERRIKFLSVDDGDAFKQLVPKLSGSADLVIVGFSLDRLIERGAETFARHSGLKEVLFVSAAERILID